MNSGRYTLTQVLDLVERKTLTRLAERYNIRMRHFGCRQRLICMGFAQLIWRESLRDIEECLNTKGARRLYAGEDLGLELDETIYAVERPRKTKREMAMSCRGPGTLKAPTISGARSQDAAAMSAACTISTVQAVVTTWA